MIYSEPEGDVIRELDELLSDIENNEDTPEQTHNILRDLLKWLAYRKHLEQGRI